MKKVFGLLLALTIALGVLFTISKEILVIHAHAKRSATFQSDPTPPPIVSISICRPDNPVGSLRQGSCGPGTFDTHQMVLGPSPQSSASPQVSPSPLSINDYVHGGVSDEHQTVFPPQSLQGNPNYLFFVASRTRLNNDTGLLVLAGVPKKEPDDNGQWTLDFAKDYGYYPTATPCVTPAPPVAPYAPIFLSPSGSTCPFVNDGQPSPDPAHQDQTFDLNYAAPGSIIFDPTSPAGSLLMIYEGTNTCFGDTGGLRTKGFYSSVAVATSVDYGKHWPIYHDTSSFAYIPLPCQNPTSGPNPWGTPSPRPLGAVGPGQVYEGDPAQPTPPPFYGRYAVLMPSVSMATAMGNGTPLPGSMGDSEMSAFLDDVNGDPSPYLYVIYNNNLNALSDPKEPGGMSIARTQLNGGTTQLSFDKWYSGSWVSNSGIGGYGSPIFAEGGPGYNCEDAKQNRFGGSLSYVKATHQYLLTFVCTSPDNPANCDPHDLNCFQNKVKITSASWFYSTNYQLSDPTQWSPPQQIEGSWSAFDQDPSCDSPGFKGWYPTFMSLSQNPGHLSTSGHVFYLYGCQTGDLNRTYSSRTFKITTTDTTPPITSASVTGPLGLNGWYTGPTTVDLTATDDLSGVANTEYSLDDGATWTTGTSISLTTSKVYNILYHSIDVDENAETPKTITVQLDSRPPLIDETASPSIISNKVRLVPVTISGKVTDNLSGINFSTGKFAVHDEYGRVEPNGSVAISPDGSYSFIVYLRTFVRAQDTDGRLYTIRVTATDNAGNSRTTEAFVTAKRFKLQPPPPCKPNCV